MSSRTRVIVMSLSAPVIAFAIVGGFLGKVTAQDTFQHLKIFDDVVNLITNNYVEPVNADKVMHGAMHGLADNLDSDSAYLSPDQVKQAESRATPPTGSVGLELTRQYYLRVIAARDNSPAAKAGLQSGDFVRAIGDQPTREMSVWEGMRALAGAPGTKVSLTIIRGGNTTDPHVIELTREALAPSSVSGRTVAAGIGYLRIAAIGPNTAQQVRTQIADLTRNGAEKIVLDVRRTATGTPEEGLAIARLFVPKGTLAMREGKAGARETVTAGSGDGAVTLPAVVLIDIGTAGAAELFASALSGNGRADLIGEHTMGRAATQKLMKLPDGSGLWLSTTRYLMPDGTPLHEKGLEPKIAVDEPTLDFGQAPPAADTMLDKALEQFSVKRAA
ncbi:MAG: S41 family peptidase [Vicinamibacterales bacterium]